MMKAIYFYLLIILFSILGCAKKEVGPQEEKSKTTLGSFENGMFILNEGNFGSNNASISFLSFKDFTISNNVFQVANDDRKLGDVAQSITRVGDKAFVVINNSKKIVKLNLNTFEIEKEINGFNSPRYLIQTGADKAYVTNFTLGTGSNPIQIIRLSDGEIIGSIPMNGWSERMVKVGNKVFIANMTEGKIMVVDSETDTEIKQIKLSKEPNSLALDGNNDLWVLCSGGFEEEHPALYKIHTDQLNITRSTSSFPISDSPSNLVCSENGDKLYFLNNGLYVVNIDYEVLPLVPFLNLSEIQYPYGLMVSGLSDEIYITDAKDFQQNGQLLHFNSTGDLLHEYEVGEGPSFMLVNK